MRICTTYVTESVPLRGGCVCLCVAAVEDLLGPTLSETATSTLDLKAYKSKSMKKCCCFCCWWCVCVCFERMLVFDIEMTMRSNHLHRSQYITNTLLSCSRQRLTPTEPRKLKEKMNSSSFLLCALCSLFKTGPTAGEPVAVFSKQGFANWKQRLPFPHLKRNNPPPKKNRLFVFNQQWHFPSCGSCCSTCQSKHALWSSIPLSNPWSIFS